MKKNYGLRYDTSFKHVYHKKEHLRQLLKDLFHQDIKNFWYSNKELSKENKNLRYGISDMVIETKDKIIVIELQNKDLENIEPRIKMYTSGFYIRQNPGKNYENVKPVEVYLILNYPYGREKVLKEYEELEKNLEETFGNLSNIKIWNIKNALKKTGTIDYDYARLFLLDKYSKSESKKILEELKKKKHLEKLVEEIELYNTDLKTFQKLKEEEEMQMTFEQATSAIKNHARQRGIEIGEKKGIKIGEKQGEKRGILKTAISMLQEGIDISTITKITGLTEKQIEEYQK